MIKSKGVKNLSATSIKKIRRMIKAVLAEPEFYNQDTFGKGLCKNDGQSTCGTVCCAAGWAVWLDSPAQYNCMMEQTLVNGGYLDGDEWEQAALAALDLVEEVEDFNELSRLFGSHQDWPVPFCEQYVNAKTPKQRAKIFAKRWEHFIKTDGLE